MPPTPPRLRVLLAALVLAAFAGRAFAAPPSGSLIDRVEDAYQSTQQYHCDVEMSLENKRGRWISQQKGDVHVALDRAAGRVLIDHPGFALVVTDKLRLRTDQYPGRHVEINPPKLLNYEGLIAPAPSLFDPPPPDVVFLLSEDPIAVLSRGRSTSATPIGADPDDPTKSPRLQFPTRSGTCTLTIDSATKLLRKAVFEADPASVGPGNYVRIVFTYTVKAHNQPIDASVFAFDTTNSKAAASLAEAAAMGMGGPGFGGAPHPLEGKAAPEIELKLLDGAPFELSDVKERIVVLNFWATWCLPCTIELPNLQAVTDWAKAENKSVGVYPVNFGETAEDVQPFWAEHRFTMPVVMDPDIQAATAYGVITIPHTVLIVEGKVHRVYAGPVEKDFAETLKAEIDKLLAPPPAEDAEAPKTSTAPAAP